MKPLNWREKTVIRILFVIARMVADNEVLSKEITLLDHHISAGFFERK